ncbi:MAG: Beta-glucosidase, partial [uncultured Phycisphaerae bacterium]
MDLRGAVALVTGGNGGLGQRICHALAKEGVRIAVMYAQSRDQAEGVASELASSYQTDAAAFACDITDGAAVERLVGDVTGRFGRLDILVNDAAYNKSIPFTDLEDLTLELCSFCPRLPETRGDDHGALDTSLDTLANYPRHRRRR